MTNEKFCQNYDVFNSKLVKNASYSGFFEMPIAETSDLIPKKLI